MLVRKDIHNSDVPRLCRSCEIRHRGVCGVMDAGQLVTLGRDIALKTVPAGTELMVADAPISSYSTILSGVVKLSKLLPDGRRQIVGLQFAPDFVGRPFRDLGPFDAEAATTVRLCAFPKNSLDRMIEASPALEHRLLEQALRELDEARNWLVTLGQKTAAERVASFLLLIASHINPEAEREEDGPVTFDLPLRRVDIADFLGITIETTSRQLSRLAREGIIEIEHSRHVTIPSLEKLRHHSGDAD